MDWTYTDKTKPILQVLFSKYLNNLNEMIGFDLLVVLLGLATVSLVVIVSALLLTRIMIYDVQKLVQVKFHIMQALKAWFILHFVQFAFINMFAFGPISGW